MLPASATKQFAHWMPLKSFFYFDSYVSLPFECMAMVAKANPQIDIVCLLNIDSNLIIWMNVSLSPGCSLLVSFSCLRIKDSAVKYLLFLRGLQSLRSLKWRDVWEHHHKHHLLSISPESQWPAAAQIYHWGHRNTNIRRNRCCRLVCFINQGKNNWEEREKGQYQY